MNKMKPLFGSTLAAFALAFCFSQSAVAVGVKQVWAVSDAAGNCGGGGDHGLWTNTLNPSGGDSCDDYFSITGTLTEYDNNTAVLDATAENPHGVMADININFAGYTTTEPTSVKNPLNDDMNDWYYYSTISSGSSIVIGGTNFDISMVTGGYAFQIGTAANDKTSEFGGSVWIIAQGGQYQGNHWDLNLDLAPVPVPAAVWLFGSGLIGLVAVARRKLHA